VKRLIVNADDFGRTDGIVSGTLDAHTNGIVTSATAMVLEPAARAGLQRARKEAPELALGLHFVLTGGGRPASSPDRIPAIAPDGFFPRSLEALPATLPEEEIRRELEAQIALFLEMTGQPPTHLDSHHHSAIHPSVGPVFAAVARERRLPARSSNAKARDQLRTAGVPTPDDFLDAFFGAGATAGNLLRLVAELPEGVSELMCHPGYSDASLRSGSSYADEREGEISALCDPRVRAAIAADGVRLASFRDLSAR
jgi:predicted glycoside hydrolase/deacetylase ChbG (UPF0249 family)